MDKSVTYLLDCLAANIEDFYYHVEKTTETLSPLAITKPKKTSQSFKAANQPSRPTSPVKTTLLDPKSSHVSQKSLPKNAPTTTSYSLKLPSPKKPVYNSTNWELSLSPVDPTDDISRLSFASLKDKALSEMIIPCAIFSHREDSEEVVFVSRLAKVITQRLFPARCVFIHSADTLEQLLPQHPLTLLSPILTQQYFPNTSPHSSFSYNKESLVIPIYSSEEYANNTGLKKDLWAILSKLPFVDTLK
ncbi:hypothetical protein [Chlamydiifrater phoenicopteri]|uniref:hypothetical protein n=1 Tax=Chlamydiifrater phoenicopteri TaxID=2681469 RepID=UPI001BCD85F8|nr:hypothetical protein [Chlamydiifrater phoenicopteri]